MGKLNGVKEKLQFPLYDAHLVEGTIAPETRTIQFFVNIQNKTRLETNLQMPSALPSFNTFEARAMRVVSNLRTPEALRELIFGSVTRLLVGEKTMIEVPTFYFPAGAGVSGSAAHGAPDPLATFRFAEPVQIEPQQNFRVELQFPVGPGADLQKEKGPYRIWVFLDGYLTRDVQ